MANTHVMYPLDQVDYGADDAAIFHGTRTNGVYSGTYDFLATPNGGMQVAVSKGSAWLNYADGRGVAFRLDDTFIVTCGTADGVLNRIDRVVIRRDSITNDGYILLKAGTPASNAVAPSLQRDGDYYEIALVDIHVNAGTIQITADLIEDKRLDEDLCGLMRDGVTGISTAQLQSQANALINTLGEVIGQVISGDQYMLKTQYSPNTVAQMKGETLEVNSVNGRFSTNYPFDIDVPIGYTPQASFVLDGDIVQILGQRGESMRLDAAPGAVVSMNRRGANVFPRFGGVSIAYDVVGGTTQPEGKENRFWVNTSVAVSSYGISDAKPNSDTLCPWGTWAVGDVLIICNGQMFPFVAYKGGSGGTFSPAAAYQYDGANWAQIALMMYVDGVWKPIRTYVFYKGTEFLQLAFVVPSTGTAENSGADIYMHGASNSTGTMYAHAYTRDSIDLTNIDRIKINITQSTGSTPSALYDRQIYACAVDYTPTRSNHATAAAQYKFDATVTGVVELDVSQLTGRYRLGLCMPGHVQYPNTIRVDEWWHE